MFRLFAIFLFFAFSLTATKSFSQDNDNKEVKQVSHKKRLKELAKKKEEQKKADEKNMEMLKERHLDNQTKEVKKRMKKSQKKAVNYNENKKGFFKKIFNRQKR
jgi:DNA-binding transcriptional regulator GbsR (MarR family)